MQGTREHYNERTFLVCIDSYKDCVPVGYFCSPFHGETDTFKSLTQLLMKIDQCLDVENIPQAFQKVRTFYPASDIWPGVFSDTPGREGRLANFVVHIYFRRNASWQGSVIWLDKKRSMKFRSVMELICLMNSALSETADHDWWADEDVSRRINM